MKTSLHVLRTLGVSTLLLWFPGGAFAQSMPDLAAATCMNNSDCAGTPQTPYCATGSMTPVCVACVDYKNTPCVPVACDGALCDTKNSSACSLVGGVGRRRAGSPIFVVSAVAVLTLALLRRRRRRDAATLAVLFAATLLTARNAAAEPEPPVDVVVHDPLPPRRYVVIGYNPLPLIVGRVSFDAVIVPADHHGIILSPFYVSSNTFPIFVFDDAGNATQLPRQTFTGFGGELGYRYYFGLRGPRGWFVGPSLILGGFTATAANGAQTKYLQYGGAADAGYQMLIVDRVSLTFGGGLQVVGTSKPIPEQQFPAKVYANFGVMPRLLISLGWAF